MRKLLNVLYITKPNRYLSLDGETLIVLEDNKKIAQFPLHNFEGIVSFGYMGASPALMMACAEKNISLCFMTPYGKFAGRVIGKTHGNVLLRNKQFLVHNDGQIALKIAKNIIIGKIFNARSVLDRMIRDHSARIDINKFQNSKSLLLEAIENVRIATSTDELRGLEGGAAVRYFDCFDDMILQQKESFFYYQRSRRPPLDNVNAMLSFAYTLLTNEFIGALDAVGLDPYVGFLHVKRPGRAALAIDMMEELRSVYCDRFVLSLINKKQLKENDFIKQENGAVILTDDARKSFLQFWQERKQEEIVHPYLKEKISWGLVPYVQAMLMSRFLRDDLEEYPPFLYR